MAGPLVFSRSLVLLQITPKLNSWSLRIFVSGISESPFWKGIKNFTVPRKKFGGICILLFSISGKLSKKNDPKSEYL